MHRRIRLSDDTGSILPLILGYAVLISALLLATADITSLYQAQRRANGLAAAAALAAADGFTFRVVDGEPVAVTDEAAARLHAQVVLDASGTSAQLSDIDVSDAASPRVSITVQWRPPFAHVVLPDGVTLGATGTARTAFG